MNSEPKISVIIPVHNQEKYLDEIIKNAFSSETKPKTEKTV